MIEVRVAISGDISDWEMLPAFQKIAKHYGGGKLLHQIGDWQGKLERGYLMCFFCEEYSEEIIRNGLGGLDIESVDVKIYEPESRSFKCD